jgi:hypothetical protein
MDAYFEEMLSRLKLTSNQKEDAKTKYTNVAKTLHAEFYDKDYDGSTKLLIGSYGKKTNIRPPHDIDLLFKIPPEIYEQYQDSPSGMLQKIRTVLGERYTTTEKISAWGKVVLIKFSEGKHDVELLPGLEIDGVFLIPNTEDGGGWESFDVGTEMKAVAESNTLTNGVTRKLVKIIKRWRLQTSSLTIKSYEIEQYCLKFLINYSVSKKSWSEIVADFFQWLGDNRAEDPTLIQTAINRSLKALDYEQKDDIESACLEWRKVFGTRTFPAYAKDLLEVHQLSIADPSPDEQYIEDLYPVKIDPNIKVAISSTISGNGFRTQLLEQYLSKYSLIPRQLSITFNASTTAEPPYKVQWKVRNFGSDARARDDLRGQIHNDNGGRTESTRYRGTHYVECYIIKDEVCVAKVMRFVPIGGL